MSCTGPKIFSKPYFKGIVKDQTDLDLNLSLLILAGWPWISYTISLGSKILSE